MAMSDLNPTELLERLIAKSCLDCLGWNDERRTQFRAEIQQSSTLQANLNQASFWRGVWFLSTQPLGYGLSHSPATWRYKPGDVHGASIMKINGAAEPLYYKIRNILACTVEEIAAAIACGLKMFGMDAELSIGQDGRTGASTFFRGWAPQSGVDGSGPDTWEHRTPPTDTIDEQISNMLVLQEHLAGYLNGKTEHGAPLKLCRTTKPCGTHLHIHAHVGMSLETLMGYLSRLAAVWNTKSYNIEATRRRWSSSYGNLTDQRSPDWYGACRDQNHSISTEYRGFTSPDFSNRNHVEAFGAVLKCAEWVLQNASDMQPITTSIRTTARDYSASPSMKSELKDVIRSPEINTVINE